MTNSKLLWPLLLLSSLILAGCLSDSYEDAEDYSTIDTTVTNTANIAARTSSAVFKPSLGVNTEAPQPESSELGGAMPFVDVFRIARPFKELSKEITVDKSGWPTSMDEGGELRTKLLYKVPKNSIPYGIYTLLYEGSGKIDFSGNVVTSPLSEELKAEGLKGIGILFTSDIEEITLQISNISKGEGNYIKDIQVIMPGGVCGSVNHLWVADASECSGNQPFESFVDKLKHNREAIVFNPGYLNFLKDFNTVRMMNLMFASPAKATCDDENGTIMESCITTVRRWVDRPKLSDAVWGGSALTSLSTLSYVKNRVERKGAPVEVLVELANQLDVNPWFNMHHAVNDAYVQYFAKYVNEHLNSHLRVYIEYSNEIWNGRFAGHHYMQLKGIELGLNSVPSEFQGYRDKEFFARLRFYSKRAVEIFDLWEAEFSGKERLIRVLGSNQGDKILSGQMLEYEDAVGNKKIDALAIGPYFSGCIVRSGACLGAPMTLSEVNSVDDVFEVIDWNGYTHGLKGTLDKIKDQANIANEHGVNLLAYEGGQNLVFSESMVFPEDAFRKTELIKLFVDANRDPRMKERYLRLLEGWQLFADKGATLFTLYTLPQESYTHGNWGLKEYLTQPRSDAPKYDAVMDFQESMLGPWWDDTIPVDSDGDGFYDRDDSFPDDINEWSDLDSDGIGDNTDTDIDGDQTPNSWEVANGLDPQDSGDAKEDLDGDSVSNIDEYRSGTDPQNSDSDNDGILDGQDTVVGSGLWGYACNVVNDPNSSTRRWGINQYNMADLSVVEAIPVYSIAQNRKIQSVACDPSGETILFSMKESVQGDYEIYELDVASRYVTQITDNHTDDVDLTRSRDGRTVAWQKRLADNRQAIELRRTQEGGGYSYKTLASASPFVQPSLSPSGEWMTFVQLRPNFFAVMRYDISNNKYTEVHSIARRKKLYHPSITDDGNLVGWSERESLRRYRVKNILDDTITDIVNNTEGVEHAVLSGDGQYVVYSVNSSIKAAFQLATLETMEAINVSDTLSNPERYLASNWSGAAASEGFTLTQLSGKQLTSFSQSLMFSLRANGTGSRYTIGGGDSIALNWQLSSGALVITEPDGVRWSAQLLAVSGNQYAVSMVVPDGEGGVNRLLDTLYVE